MDFNTIIATIGVIASIILGILQLKPQKQLPEINVNSKNSSNIDNSIKVKIENQFNIKNDYKSASNSKNNSNSSEDILGFIFVIIIAVLIGTFILSKIYINYKFVIINTILLSGVLGIIASFLFLKFSKLCKNFNGIQKTYLILCWLPTFIILLLIDINFNETPSIETIKMISDSSFSEYVQIFNNYSDAIMFIFYKCIVIAISAVIIALNIRDYYIIIKGKYTKKYIIGSIFISTFLIIISFCFSSGLFTSLLTYLENLSQ